MCWDLLGIDPTGNRREIKRAYTSRLKKVHPEDDPEGFQELRAAYEEALSWMEEPEDEPLEETEATVNLMEPLQASLALVRENPEQEKEAPRPRRRKSTAAPRGFKAPTAEQRREENDRISSAVDSLMRAVMALETGTLDSWALLLDCELFWDLDVRSGFREKLFTHLGTSRRELDRGVWVLLDQRFRWRETSREFYRTMDESAVDWVLEQIHEARRFRPVPPAPKTDSPPPQRRPPSPGSSPCPLFSRLPESSRWCDVLLLLSPWIPFLAALLMAVCRC